MAELRSTLQSALGSGYTIQRELGGGGMSHVFLAEEQALSRHVVVKVLPPDVSAGVNVERFKREIQVSAKLQHPHIVPVLSTGEMQGVPYYVMPFVEGESLRARLVRTGALSITDAVSVLRDVARALAYAHERGVAHRDIKPDNILLSGGSATVADFGIAKAITAARDDERHTTLTQVGTSLGTPAYMAPEQAAADPATNHRADIYAFGCVAFEVLAGRPPFTEKTPQRLLAAQMSERPQPVATLRPDTPPELADLVMRCLEKEADARPQNASDLVRVLETVTSGGGHTALPAILLGGPGMLRRALGWYAAAFVAVLILAEAAVITIGLPPWVLPGATIVMLMGLPVILFTAYVQRVTRRAITMTPTYTPGGTPSMPQGTMATLAMKASPHVSWSRAAKGGVYAVGSFILVVGAFMVLRALGIGPAGSLLAKGVLGDRDRILVGDFRVHAADSSLVDVIGEAVRSDLSQSNVINVVPTTAVASTLQLMQRTPTTRLDSALAREVATRVGAKAIVDGDIVPLPGGTGFVVQIQMRTADSSAVIASFSQTAAAATDLIPVLGKLGKELRGRIGESLRRVNASPPLDAVTTGSLEALRKYVEANRLSGGGDDDGAIRLLHEAIALDTGFAMAYRKLGVAMNNSDMPVDSANAVITKAYQLRGRLTERERHMATAYYYWGGPGRDRAKGAAAYEALLAQYPDDYAALNNLGLIYNRRRDFVRAESTYRRGIAVPDARPIVYNNLVEVLMNQGRSDEARRVVEEAKRRFPGSPALAMADFTMAAEVSLDSLKTLALEARTGGTGRLRAISRWILSEDARTHGQLDLAMQLLGEARRLDSARGIPLEPLQDSLVAAFLDVWMRGRPDRAIQRVDRALALYPLTTLALTARPYFDAAALYAFAGKPSRAYALLSQEATDVSDTSMRRYRQPFVHRVKAEIALAEGRPLDAVREMRLGDVWPDGPVSDCQICLYADLARAFDAANMPDSTIAMLEKYLTTPYFLRTAGDHDPFFLAATYRRLGELYEAKGERAKAYTSFAKFVELWKDADPDLQPRVQDARRRLARLKDVEAKP